MKIKVMSNDVSTRKRFFLLMIVPMLMGLMITLTNFANADWDKKDERLLLRPSPIKQGWTQIQTHHVGISQQ